MKDTDADMFIQNF